MKWLGLPEGRDDTAVADHLASALMRQKLLKEVATFAAGVLDRWEIPYGLAWALMLHDALETSPLIGLRRLAPSVQPLKELARRRLRTWMTATNSANETGTHGNAAFSLSLIKESDSELWADLSAKAQALWRDATPRTLIGEAGPHDFLSPSLSAAELITSTIDDPEEANRWLAGFLPNAAEELRRLEPAFCPDPSDGLSSHLLGLNLSRAHSLFQIAKRLGPTEIAIECLKSADRHLSTGVQALAHDHFASTHWIGTFALRAIQAAPSAPAD